MGDDDAPDTQPEVPQGAHCGAPQHCTMNGLGACVCSCRPCRAARAAEAMVPDEEHSRQQLRAEAKVEARRVQAATMMAQNAERVVLGQEQAAKLQRQRHMLMAAVRGSGRLRISKSDLDAIAKAGGAQIESKVEPNGDLVLSYLGDGHS